MTKLKFWHFRRHLIFELWLLGSQRKQRASFAWRYKTAIIFPTHIRFQMVSLQVCSILGHRHRHQVRARAREDKQSEGTRQARRRPFTAAFFDTSSRSRRTSDAKTPSPARDERLSSVRPAANAWVTPRPSSGYESAFRQRSCSSRVTSAAYRRKVSDPAKPTLISFDSVFKSLLSHEGHQSDATKTGSASKTFKPGSSSRSQRPATAPARGRGKPPTAHVRTPTALEILLW